MKKQIVLFTGIMLAVAAVLPVDTEAQGRHGGPSSPSRQVQNESEYRVIDPQRPGFRFTADERPILQLENLTQDQRSKITEMHQKHQAEISHLTSLMRNNRIDTEAFISRRRDLFERHQEQLQEILTNAQWDELQSMRTERRTVQRDLRSSYHVNRARLIAGELDLDEQTVEELVSIVQSRQANRDQFRGPADQSVWQRGLDRHMRVNALKLNLEMQDKIREVLDDETYLEWQMLWRAGTGQRSIGYAGGVRRNIGDDSWFGRPGGIRPGWSGRPAMRRYCW